MRKIVSLVGRSLATKRHKRLKISRIYLSFLWLKKVFEARQRKLALLRPVCSAAPRASPSWEMA
jgi:hypothetical protein